MKNHFRKSDGLTWERRGKILCRYLVCSLDPERTEKAIFSNVRLTIPAPEGFVPYRDFIGSRLELLDVRTGRRKVIYESEVPFEAPIGLKTASFLLSIRRDC
jgi:hypothetical protein